MINKKITATGMEITEAIENYIEKKIEHLEKFIRGVGEVMVEVRIGKTTHHHQKGDLFRAEMDAQIGKDVFRAEAQTADLYASIDIAKDELFAEIRKAKSKRLKILKVGHQKIKNILKRFGHSDD